MKKLLTILFLALSLSGFSQNFFWSHTPDKICFGYLYNWYAVDDARELTSSADWSVPTETQINGLINYAGGTLVAADKLKVSGTIFWNTDNGTNDYGFNAIGNGARSSTLGLFQSIKNAFTIYTSTVVNSTNVTVLNLYDGGTVYFGDGDNRLGYAIRLVKDATGLADGVTTTYTGNDGKTYNAVVINELYWTTENLEETQYRNLDYIQGYDGGVYTPISNAAWAALTTGALCVYDDDLNNQCK